MQRAGSIVDKRSEVHSYEEEWWPYHHAYTGEDQGLGRSGGLPDPEPTGTPPQLPIQNEQATHLPVPSDDATINYGQNDATIDYGRNGDRSRTHHGNHSLELSPNGLTQDLSAIIDTPHDADDLKVDLR